MGLGIGYGHQACNLARALEVVGERWTLLILRDCFYGVRHFGDLLAHLDVSRAVLAERLDTLVKAGVLFRESQGRMVEYRLTEAGLALWPTIYSLSKWGETYVSSDHPPRVFSHAACGTVVDSTGRCVRCDITPHVADLVVSLAARRAQPGRTDRVARALEEPHRMLEPIP